MTRLRIGHGYDVHRLVPNRDMIIGGVKIDYELGLDGHSDADVLVHAIMDALLGAAGMRDIGYHFPDTKEEFRGASSIMLLESVGKMLADGGYAVVNIDSTLILQRPKIAPYIEKMSENIAEALGIERGAVNVKATTEERLGFTGSGEGAAAHAVALIERI